jgi:hypothetical protein
MKKYNVSYKIRNPKYPQQITFLFSWATETIEARGIVHASKLAKAHKTELQKVAFDKLEIEWIREITNEE